MTRKTSTEVPMVSSDALAQLTALCAQAVDTEKRIAEIEKQIKAEKERYRALTEEDIPTFMSEIGTGIAELKLTDGTKIKIKEDVYASIPAAQQVAAFSWLEAHGFGGLIKTEVVVSFGREEAETAKKFAAELMEQGLEPELTRGVHSQTLRAFLREQLEKATEVPLDLFGAHAVKIAKITPAKV